eukprot:gene2165-2665_t
MEQILEVKSTNPIQALQFIWHKSLQIIGDGIQTLVGYHYDNPDLILPVIVNHSEQSKITCIQALQTFPITHGYQENHIYYDLSKSSNILDFDSFIVVGDTTITETINSYPICLFINDHGDNGNYFIYKIRFSNIYSESAIRHLLNIAQKLLQQIESNPDRLVSDLDFLTDEQVLELERWNNTDGEFSHEMRLHHLIEDAVNRTPDKEAVVSGSTRLTYRQLEEMASKIGSFLHNHLKIQTEQFVGLFLEKNELLIGTIFGIWKCGAAYIPVDTSSKTPDARVHYILVTDTQVKFVITNRKHYDRLCNIFGPDWSGTIVVIEDLLNDIEQQHSTTFQVPGLKSDMLAYITYTSGTTGQAKGVYKTHMAVLNSITDLSEKYEMTPEKTTRKQSIVLFAAYVFEPFVRQTLMALINSHRLVIINDEDKLDPVFFKKFLIENEITYLNGTASVLQKFDYFDCPHLEKMVLVGEEFTNTRFNILRKLYSGLIINEFGMTESALVTATKKFMPNDLRTDRSIGRPGRNVKCYILSDQMKQVPIGSRGFLYIGGAGVSSGYLNLPVLTKERFLSNPYQTKLEKLNGTNKFIYNTGDLARFLPNGEIEYLGRRDFQIKLNGIRIEPGEIESTLYRHGGIDKCCVVAKETKDTNGKYLVGYYVSNDSMLKEKELISYLEKLLPALMVPTRLIRLLEIPTNINGKTDLKKLPDIDDPSLAPLEEIELPRNELDHQLLAIWKDVLGLDNIGIKQDFYRLGGHSINLIQLISRIRESIHINILFEDVHRERTIEKLSDYLSSNQSLENKSQDQTIIDIPNIGNEVDGIFFANSLQQGFIYHDMKQGIEDDAYIWQSWYRYSTDISVQLFKNSWEYAQKKYSSLRLRFINNETLVQIIDKNQPLDWRYSDISSLADTNAQEMEIQNIISKDRKERFSLENGQLFRIYFIKQNENLYSCILSCHHIILDGWSLPILFGYVNQTYLLLKDGQSPKDDPDNSYINAQKYLQSHPKDTEYWNQIISSINDRVDLSGLLNDSSRNKIQLLDIDYVKDQKNKSIIISAKEILDLKERCSLNGITIHSILQFVWHYVLHVYGGGTHTVVGTTISGRNIPVDIERSVGLYINTLPLIVDHSENNTLTVVQSILNIQSKVCEMIDRSNTEIGKLKGDMKHRLFDTLFVLENYPNIDNKQAQYHRDQLKFKHEIDIEKLDYPLAVVARELHDDSLQFSLYFAGELIEDGKIDEILHVFRYILNQIPEKWGHPIETLDYLLPSTKELLSSWNETDADFSETHTLHGIFEQVVQSYPDHIAVVYEDVKLTYRQLNEKANQLANYIRSLVEIKPDELIALFLDKNELMIISILGVWKSGAAFVPIEVPTDSGFSVERIQHILEDINPQICITNRNHSDKLPIQHLHVIEIDNYDNDMISKFDCKNLNPISTSMDLAYVIFTSGTTGKPKGVQIAHIGVVNLKESLAKTFALNNDPKDEVILSFSNYVFDHFYEQMTDAILNGQILVVLNDEMRTDKQRLYKYMKDNKVTYLSGTPSVLSKYKYYNLTDLRRIDAVGEDFTEALFLKIRKSFKGVVINGYGPTEISITSHKRIYQPDETRKNKSIGFPVDNTACYVLDSKMKPVPIGSIGELWIGGVGVARGYLNGVGKDKFIQNPFPLERKRFNGKNTRLYKTGDLVRFLPNSEVEYLSRNDFQVKINGLRIELGEIEQAILLFPNITDAIVLLKTNSKTSQKVLVGYYVSKSNLSEKEIFSHLRLKLQEYKVPKVLIPIDSRPCTKNGKLDTAKLPSIDFIPRNTEYVAPTNEIELKLCKVLSDTVGIDVDQIGVNDDFSSLGLDSILSLKLIFEIGKEFNKKIQVRDVISNRSVYDLSLFLQKIEKNSNAIKSVCSQQVVDSIVSISQERLLFIDQLEKGTSFSAYNIPLCLKFSNTIDRCRLIKAISQTISRHEILLSPPGKQRTDISPLDLESMVTTTVLESLESLDSQLIKDDRYKFNLDQELPFRISIYQIGFKDLYVHFVFHHVCFDGWSWNIIQNEILQQINDPNLNLQKSEIQYRNYSIWQRNRLIGEYYDTLLNYWKHQLVGYEPLNLITDFPRPQSFDYSGKDIKLHISKEVSDGLKALSKQLQVTLNSVLVSAYCLLLSCYTNQNEIVIGSPFTNRPHPDLYDMVGFFVNMLVLRVGIDKELSLGQYIQSVSKTILQGQIHQEMPFEKLVKFLEIENDTSRHPIFQSIFNMNPVAVVHNDQIEHYSPNSELETIAKFDLSVTVSDGGEDGIQVIFNYATSLFREQTIQGMVNSFDKLLVQFTKTMNTTIKLNQLPSAFEPCQLDFINNESYYQEDSLLQLFEESVLKTPNRTAIIYQDIKITFKELDEMSDCVANEISKKITRNEELVSLFLEKNHYTIISILGVLKTGSAYVPIDPTNAKDRIKFIIKDTKSKILITNKKFVQQFLDSSLSVIDIESIEYSKNNASKFIKPIIQKNNLAYVIYTSGTTGNPKPITIEHVGIINLRNCLVEKYFGKNDKEQSILFLSNYVFDFSVEQMVLSILSSNTLVIPKDLFICEEFYKYLNDSRLTYISGTPTFIEQLDFSKFNHVEMLTVAGEAFNNWQFKKIRSSGFTGILNNAYGVTETTVYNMVKTYHSYEDEFVNSIGEPLPNMKVYILNDRLQMVPKDAIGEIYISGNCLSRHYLNLEQVTKQRFIENPYQTEKEKKSNMYSRLYKTGDVARYTSNGCVEYLGRSDTQVKIRAFRVELSEIDAVLSTYHGIKQCATIPIFDNDGKVKHLIGYYVSDSPLVEDDIISFLTNKLPNYMIPSRIVFVEKALPITINGKLNVQELPKIDFRSLNDHHNRYIPPTNPIEFRLCEIWSELLDVRVGIDDDFFRLGGDSIKSMEVVRKIQRDLKLENLTVRDIFEQRTIRKIAKKNFQQSPVTIKSEQGVLCGELPLLPIQQWFFNKNLKYYNHWNQSFTIKVPYNLDIDRLKDSISKLESFHDALRLRFKRIDNIQIFQSYGVLSTEVKLNRLDIDGRESSDISKTLLQWQQQLDIENGPVYSVGYIDGYKDGSSRIWFAIHHLAVDAISWRIICQDLNNLYNGIELSSKSTSYRQWSQAIQSYPFLDQESKYWSEIRDNVDIYNEKLVKSLTTSKATFRISKEMTSNLFRSSKTGIDELLLTGLGKTLEEITGQNINFITMESHGRDYFDSTLNVINTVGWFTTMFVVELKSYDEDWSKSINYIKESLMKIPNKGIGYGASYGYSSMPKISYNYLGQFHEDDGTSKISTDEWSLTDLTGEYENDRHPDNTDHYDVIDITAICINGELRFNIVSKLLTTNANTIAEKLSQNLEKILGSFNSYPIGSNQHKEEVYIPYFEYRVNENYPTLHILPPGEGGAESYLGNIQPKLSSSVNVILYNNYYRWNKSQQGTIRFEELAKYYINHIKSIQPRGPYNFLGWSFGGLLSMEISRQLVEAGESIDNLMFIDSYFNVKKAYTYTLGDLKNANFPVDDTGAVYHLGVGLNAISPRILTVGDKKRAAKLSQFLDKEPEPKFSENRGFEIYTGFYKGVRVSIVSIGMGIPMMDFLVREGRYITQDTMAIIRFGTCGALVDTPVGSLAVASDALLVRRNPDHWHPESDHSNLPKPYDISLPYSGDRDLVSILESEIRQTIPERKVVVGINATADSFYSSQGRIDPNFDDRNEDLIKTILEKQPKAVTLEMETFQLYHLAKRSKIPIKAAATTIVLANRLNNDFLSNQEKEELELKGGKACLEALIKISLD